MRWFLLDQDRLQKVSVLWCCPFYSLVRSFSSINPVVGHRSHGKIKPYDEDSEKSLSAWRLIFIHYSSSTSAERTRKQYGIVEKLGYSVLLDWRSWLIGESLRCLARFLEIQKNHGNMASTPSRCLFTFSVFFLIRIDFWFVFSKGIWIESVRQSDGQVLEKSVSIRVDLRHALCWPNAYDGYHKKGDNNIDKRSLAREKQRRREKVSEGKLTSATMIRDERKRENRRQVYKATPALCFVKGRNPQYSSINGRDTT